MADKTQNIGTFPATDKFSLISKFLGYRNKEDQTNLDPGYLVKGSRDVLNTTGGRIGVRKGYTLDGQADTTIAPINSSFDWIMHNGNERNLRADRKSTRLNSSHRSLSRMPSSA